MRKNRTQAYFDEVVCRLGKNYAPGRSWKALAGALLRILNYDVVADLGAGEGFVSQLISPSAKQVIAVDNSPSMVELGQELARKHGLDNLEYRLGDIEALFEQRFALPPAAVAAEKNMQGKVIAERRIDPVGGKAAAQAVGALVHGDHAPGHGLAAHAPPLPGDHGRDRTAGGDAHLSFQLSHHTHPFRGKSKRRSPQEDILPPKTNAVVRY